MRRKVAHRSASQERQRSILQGVMQILKYSGSQEVQDLLRLIRGDANASSVASCLKQNLQALQEKGIIPAIEIDETDILSIGVQSLFNQRVGGSSSKSSDDASSEPRHNRKRRDVGNKSETTTSEASTVVSLDTAYLEPNRAGSDATPLGDGLPDGNHHEARGAWGEANSTTDEEDDSAKSFPESVSDPQSTESSNGWFKAVPDILPRTSPHATETSPDKHRILSLPTSSPSNPLDAVCLAFLESCQQMLFRGYSYDQLNNFGTMDCELLFRERMAHDDWNIPNWACEVARRLPDMLPGTRLAMALCMARVMPYLINPSPQVLATLPGVLRPTDLQLRVVHDISANFIPIPALRNLLMHESADFYTLLGSNDYRVEWQGVWGDVGGAVLTRAGSWEYDLKTISQQTRDSVRVVEGQPAKAVMRDRISGRRYISEQFQRCCWIFNNWSIRRDILQIWPDLSGHIQLV
ncbi:hypothetical protein LTR05_007512 [Lithohypha guttulata]|uniref:Uncharacterized protein n=1 Tax=Lithohypha guttulata TaxID=1690604 RepID=A0AAN7SV89_9EURO|nr:hypothetical protein LTR05_007512 [Lithohypha guttulata]